MSYFSVYCARGDDEEVELAWRELNYPVVGPWGTTAEKLTASVSYTENTDAEASEKP